MKKIVCLIVVFAAVFGVGVFSLADGQAVAIEGSNAAAQANGMGNWLSILSGAVIGGAVGLHTNNKTKKLIKRALDECRICESFSGKTFAVKEVVYDRDKYIDIRLKSHKLERKTKMELKTMLWALRKAAKANYPDAQRYDADADVVSMVLERKRARK